MKAAALAPNRLTALAIAAHCVDPIGTGILRIRARAGPARDRVLFALRTLDPAAKKIGTTISDEALFGGLDVTRALADGTVVQMPGVLDRSSSLILGSAERCPSRLAAHLSAAVDRGGHSLVLCDEGASPEEEPPDSLCERVGLYLSLDDRRDSAPFELPAATIDIEGARARCNKVTISDERASNLVIAAAQLGIVSLRAPLCALAIARALAALENRAEVSRQDLEIAAALAFGHRATRLPDFDQPAEEPPAPPEAQHEAEDQEDAADADQTLPAEMLLEAAKALLPDELLARIGQNGGNARNASGSGAGSAKIGNRRGRPLPSRPGRTDGGARVDIVATLRAAAPWQTIRRAASEATKPIHIRRSDIRLKRYEETSDRLLIFTVDASGSQALARLAEAKGAVEILLSEAYARRDHVALIGFRGDGAEMLLPPTRSLVQTKRRLNALPGGGGTPLAAGLKLAAETATRAVAQGMTPYVVVLTDGRANIALDGSANRAAAAEDAENMGKSLLSRGIETLIIDTGQRPSRSLTALSDAIGSTYLALPRSDAYQLSAAVSDAIGD